MAKQLRQDITGLRAIAVVSVTLFHLMQVFLPDVKIFHGGFLGVDIFFVISGFLMTMIIMRGLEKGTFDLIDFYKRRAKRICPALMVTVMIFLALGMLVLGTGDLKRLAYEGFYALFFVSNIYFGSNTDYFANNSLDQVFLHTWSLSVEWQFYLFFPLVMIYLKRKVSSQHIGLAVLGLTVLSLIFAAWYTAYYPRYSYYMLPSRSFELLVGALAWFYPLSFFQQYESNYLNNRKDDYEVITFKQSFMLNLSVLLQKVTPRQVEIAGLLIIVASLALIDDSNGWPSMAAVFPLFGTYLCISANNSQSVLRNVVWQKLGLWSYAIYLAHWPILVFVTKLGFYAWCFELLIPIILLGLLLHYGVERRRDYGYIALALYFATAIVAFYVASSGGAKFRLEHQANRYAQYGGHTVPFEGVANVIGDKQRPTDFILVGDSFARHYTLDLIDRGLNVMTVFRDGCYSFSNHVNRRSEGIIDEKCRLRYDNAIETIAKMPSDLPIVFAQDWPRYRNALVDRKTGKDIGEANFKQAVIDDLQALSDALGERKVYILGTPRQTVYDIGSTCMFLHALDNPLSKFMRSNFTCINTKHLNETPVNSWLLPAVESHKNFTYIDPNDAICVDGDCEILVGDYIPVYQDGLHYSWAGSVKVVSYILSRIGVEQGAVRTDFADGVNK